jgi:hypothetical protein
MMDNVWQALPSYVLYVVIGLLSLAVGVLWLNQIERKLSPQAKAGLTRRFPTLLGVFDTLYAARKYGLNDPRLKRGLRSIALGARAPAIVAAIDALDNDPDADGITLNQGEPLVGKGYGLAPMPPLELPPTVYPPPTAELAARAQLSERYVLVHSLVPPSLGDDERSTKHT